MTLPQRHVPPGEWSTVAGSQRCGSIDRGHFHQQTNSLCTIPNGQGYHLWRVLPLKGASVEANDLTGTICEAILCWVTFRLILLWGAFSDEWWAYQSYVDGWILSRTQFSLVHLQQRWCVLQVNNNTIVYIWGFYIPEYLSALTTQNTACGGELSNDIHIYHKHIWDDLLVWEFFVTCCWKSENIHIVHAFILLSGT